jgi:hypothetical protein
MADQWAERGGKGDPLPMRLLAVTGRGLWLLVRVPALAVLCVLEPFVVGLLSAVSALGLLSAIFFGLLVKWPGYPFWGMVAFSVGCSLISLLYYALMRLLGWRDR